MFFRTLLNLYIYLNPFLQFILEYIQLWNFSEFWWKLVLGYGCSVHETFLSQLQFALKLGAHPY